MKPYRGGNIALRAIHDLDVTDKHRALLPVLSGVSLPLGKLFGTNLPDSVGNWRSLIDHDGQMIIGTADYLKIPLGTELPARFFLALDFGPGIGFRPVIEGLHELGVGSHGRENALDDRRTLEALGADLAGGEDFGHAALGEPPEEPLSLALPPRAAMVRQRTPAASSARACSPAPSGNL